MDAARGWALGMLVMAGGPAASQSVDFNREVLPLLSARCFACHGPDQQTRRADLRLDVRAGAVADRDGMPAIVPGQPAQSELLARLVRTDAERMPPARTGPPLSPAQVELLRRWIEQGATYTEHWAFVPPVRPPVPFSREPPASAASALAGGSRLNGAIDAFLAVQLRARRLAQAPPAPREVLVRRATLDLLGLPPTPEDVDAFVNDPAPDAYERLIDRLLASPHYGERWGRHWLDIVRYADSGGFETDIFFAHAWRYRDYVIRSWSADKPFDRFVREQVAGDELFPGDQEALLGTSLYTIGPVLQEAGMVAGKLDHDLLTDAVDTTGAAFLGLTAACARCHDHKYDPLSQRDYFGLQAIFAASEQLDLYGDGRRSSGNKLAVKSTLTQFEIEQLKSRASRERDPAMQSQHLDKLASLYRSANKARSRDDKIDARVLDEPSLIPVRVLAHREAPLEVRLLQRGELEQPRAVIAPALPAKLARTVKAPSRAALADWLAARDNPLTARVLVNRVWQWHFGQGLVRTPNDFGVRGDRPTHPELLDWLAVEFMEHGWSIKHLHRLIMRSSAYQLSSTIDAATLSADPDNRLLTRFQPRRLEAEAIWDVQRAVAGTLDRTMYDLPFAPPLDDQEQIGNFRKWPASLPDEANRRGVYLLIKRSFRFPLFSAFDPPDNVTSCGQRDSTTVPNQALTLLNSRAVHEQSRAFAARLRRESDGSPGALATRAWRLAYGRTPTEEERGKVIEFLTAPQRSPRPVQELCLALFNTNEFIYLP